MKQSLVSIIIPFYNEEEYLTRAIDSAINQSYLKTEIILVNDGSTDGSKGIADSYCEKYSNIFCIHSSNESLGSARNKGIIKANGQYITFLDADDELLPKMIEKCIEVFSQNDIDVTISKFNLLDEKGGLLKIAGWNKLPLIINSSEAIKAMYSGKIIPTAWGKMYKSEIIKSIKFPEGIWFEDNPFLIEVFFNSEKIGCIDSSLLSIHSRKNSITRRLISEKRMVDLHKAFLIQLKVVEKYETILSSKRGFYELIFSNQIQAMLDNFLLLKIDQKDLNNDSEIKLRNCFHRICNSLNRELKNKNIKIGLKKRVLFWILNLPKYIGWNFPELMLVFIKGEKYNYLKKIKG
ncbi:glycosyltransferase family 2 protein [Urechidicola croceus]|uniref:Glycosyltransferase 2-like domain-containing protein n=1 Tax=Urechidicola croceus TaxID=1850246 RepID=A0A1D8PA65_9FLAO|nr:glycosyltransferase family 2 protein [Urechidicola croceus]AOW21472.1 hypothetical protein LPB138_12625 [Urechidicola croceus]